MTWSGVGVAVRALAPADAQSVGHWHYAGPWAVYDGRPDGMVRLSGENGYHAIIEETTGAFLGYVCIGAEARVAGLAGDPDLIDVGVGLDPAVTGRGRGASILAPVLAWVTAGHPGMDQRAVVQSWNKRSLRLCEVLGFRVTGHHEAVQQQERVDYVVLRRDSNCT